MATVPVKPPLHNFPFIFLKRGTKNATANNHSRYRRPASAKRASDPDPESDRYNHVESSRVDQSLSHQTQFKPTLEAMEFEAHNISHVGLSSLKNGAKHLKQLVLAYGPVVTIDLGKFLLNYSRLKSIRLDGCLVTCSATKAIRSWCASLTELSLSKCSGVTDK
ncbi:hypothetical protein ACFX2I_040906 [Malus domestica]